MKRAAPNLLAIRHAPVAVEGICYGQTDVPTTLTARQAADRIESIVAEHAPHTLWSSDALRCHGPARILAERLGIPHRFDARLREFSYGEWEGMAWERIPHRELDPWMAEWTLRAPPGGETLAAFAERVAGWWSELDPGPHFLMAHAGVVHSLDMIVDGLSWETTFARRLDFLAARSFAGGAGG